MNASNVKLVSSRLFFSPTECGYMKWTGPAEATARGTCVFPKHYMSQASTLARYQQVPRTHAAWRQPVDLPSWLTSANLHHYRECLVRRALLYHCLSVTLRKSYHKAMYYGEGIIISWNGEAAHTWQGGFYTVGWEPIKCIPYSKCREFDCFLLTSQLQGTKIAS